MTGLASRLRLSGMIERLTLQLRPSYPYRQRDCTEYNPGQMPAPRTNGCYHRAHKKRDTQNLEPQSGRAAPERPEKRGRAAPRDGSHVPGESQNSGVMSRGHLISSSCRILESF